MGTDGTPANGGTTTTAPEPPLDRPDPDFEITGAEVVARAATPTLRFNIEITDASAIRIHFIALSALITVEPGMRTYESDDRERLVELFGEPERWGSTTGAFRWTQVDTVVPAFTERGSLRLPVQCTYDHEIAATKYFGGIDSGTYPLQFHFNGTVYYEGADGRLQMLPLAWDRSARFELPVETWRRMIDLHYPEGGWMRLGTETLRRLGQRKAESGAPTMDDCISRLLDRAEQADDEAGEPEGGG